MPIDPATDCLIHLTTKLGAAGNSTASTPAASLGKYLSTTQLVDNNLHNLFDLLTAAENELSENEYRCLAIRNADGALDFLSGSKVYISAQVAGGASIAIGLDPAAASPIGQVAAQFAEIATEDIAPAGVVFSSPVDYATGLALGVIPPGNCKGLWVRRTAAASAAQNNDGVTIRVRIETAA